MNAFGLFSLETGVAVTSMLVIFEAESFSKEGKCAIKAIQVNVVKRTYTLKNILASNRQVLACHTGSVMPRCSCYHSKLSPQVSSHWRLATVEDDYYMLDPSVCMQRYFRMANESV